MGERWFELFCGEVVKSGNGDDIFFGVRTHWNTTNSKE